LLKRPSIFAGASSVSHSSKMLPIANPLKLS
jgi:hypothetical protein